MSGRVATAEKHIMDLFNGQNRPFSVQVVADFVAQFGVKKAQVQKSLDSLAENGKICVKEFGKTRIFWPKQTQDEVLSKEELEKKKRELGDLKEVAQQETEELGQLQTDHTALTTALKSEELDAEIERTIMQKEELLKKLESRRDHSAPVSAEDRKKAEENLNHYVQHWTKWKKAFGEIWGAVSEDLNKKKSELFEEIGVDTDEQAGCALEEMCSLTSHKRRRRCK